MRTPPVRGIAFSVLVFAGLAAACGGGGDTTAAPAAPTETPAITLSLSASALSVTSGASVTLTVTVTRTGGFTGLINLAVSGLPGGVTALFDPSSVSGATSTLTVAANAGAAPGVSTITVNALGAGVAPRTATATLTVVGATAAVASVSVTPGGSYILTADTLQLSATPRDAASGTLTGREVSWSSNSTSVATVDGTGRVLPVAPGVAVITATCEGRSATATVSVSRGRGLRVPGLMAYDSILLALMERYRVPGAAIAVMRNGKLVLARGYGFADTLTRTLVEPTSLFRIASVSKPITSAAVLKLVERGELSLDSKAFTILSDIRPANVAAMDPRLLDITVRQLLTHAAGWDRDISGDPMFMSTAASSATQTSAPASLENILRYWMSRSLDFTPGARYAYSNLGYAVLGLIIERVSGLSYEQFVQANVLSPAGATRMRLGRTLRAQRAAAEVQYYDQGTTISVFPGGGTVAWPDGGFALEPMAAHGGWIASAPDLLRFVGAVDGFSERADLLSAGTLAGMSARPAVWSAGSYWYGFGWLANTAGNWWHDGSLPGSTTLLVRTSGNVAWAVLLNSRTVPTGLGGIGAAIDSGMWDAFSRVTVWPTHDLFDRY